MIGLAFGGPPGAIVGATIFGLAGSMAGGYYGGRATGRLYLYSVPPEARE